MNKNPENLPENSAKAVKRTRKRPFLLRILSFLLRSVFLIVLFTLIIVTLSTWYFLGTNDGARQLISFANQFTDYDISAEEVDGRLGDKLTLTNIKVQGDVNMTAKKATLSWSPKKLLETTLYLKELSLANADIIIPPNNEEKDHSALEKSPTLEDIRLPIGIIVDNVSVKNIRIIQSSPDKTSTEILSDSIDQKRKVDNDAVKDVAKNAGKKAAKTVVATDKEPASKAPIFIIDHAKLAAKYVDGAWQIDNFTFTNPDLSTQVQAVGKTLDEYPIALSMKSKARAPEIGEVTVRSELEGAVGKNLQLITKLSGAVNANLALSANQVLSSPRAKLALDIKSVDFNRLSERNDTPIPLTKLAGRITAHGDLNKLNANLDLHATHKDFGDIRAVADVSGAPLKTLSANVKTTGFIDATLTASVKDLITTTGQTPNPIFDSKLAITHISSSLLNTDEATNISGTVSAKGSIEDLTATLDASAQSSRLGKVTASMRANFDGKAISVGDLLIALPETQQKITGQAALNLASEKLNATLKSNRFTFPQNSPEVTMKDLDLRVDGALSNYTATLQGDIQVKDIPPLSVNATVTGDQTQLTDSDITIKLLGGTVEAKGRVAWAPNLRVDANVTAKNIQPQQFFPEIKAKLNSDLAIKASQDNESVSIVADLKDLSGTLRGQPVHGKGRVKVNDKVINIDALDIDLAGNRLLANGSVSADQLDLRYDIDATSLEKLLPDLRGAVSGKGTLKGSPTKPDVKATLSANNIGYQNYRVGKANISADIDMRKNRLNVDAKTADLMLDKEKIQSATVNVNGRFSQHELQAELISDARTAKVVGQGKLDVDKLEWSGTVSRVKVNEKSLNALGKWQTQSAFSLTASPERVKINKLCLVQSRQKSAKICVDGGLKDTFKNGEFDISIKNFNSTLFKDYLPKEVKLDNVLSGQANVELQSGKPTITGKIQQDKPGNLTLDTGNNPFKDKIQTLALEFSLKKNTMSAKANLKLEKLGKAKIEAGLPDISKDMFSTRVLLDIPSLEPLESFVPDLANLKGSVNGDIAIKGTTKGQLNATGDIKLNKTRFDVPAYNTQIRDLKLTIAAGNNNQLLFNGSAKGGNGEIVISGSANPLAQTGKINVKGKNFRVAKSAQYFIELSPNLDVMFGETLKIRGKVGVPTAVISPNGGSGKSKVTTSDDVINPRKEEQKAKTTSLLDADISILLGKNVRVNTKDISMGLSGDMRVTVKPGQPPRGSGTVNVQTGRYRFYGQELDIKRGRVIFSGALENPSLDINAERKIEEADEEVIVGVNILGTAKTPRISLYSRPGLSDADILSYLAFGRRANSENFAQGVALEAAGALGTNQIARNIKNSTGLDVFDLTLSSLEVGKNLSKKAYVGYKRNFFSGINKLIAKYHIKSCLKAEATYSTGSDTGFDFICAFESD